MSLNTLYWEITGSCNQSCSHCHLGGSSSWKKLESIEYVDRIHEFARNGIETLLLTGGEPLLNPYIFDMVKVAKSYNIDTAILTNGTLINEKMANSLADASPTTIQISIDGIKSYHDQIRGHGAFYKIEKAIHSLDNVDIKPLMKMTLTNQNIDHVVEVINYTSSKNLRLNLSLAQDFGNVHENGIMPNPKKYFETFINLYKWKKKDNLQLTLPDFSIEEYLDTGRPKAGCSAGSKMATITKDDKLLPCVFMSSLGLNEESLEYSEKILNKPDNLSILLQKYAEDFGCPLRRFQYGFDPYSVYEFTKFIKNENL